MGDLLLRLCLPGLFAAGADLAPLRFLNLRLIVKVSVDAEEGLRSLHKEGCRSMTG